MGVVRDAPARDAWDGDTFGLYCRCGAMWEGTVADRNTGRVVLPIARLARLFEEFHGGRPGCEPVGRRLALAANLDRPAGSLDPLLADLAAAVGLAPEVAAESVRHLYAVPGGAHARPGRDRDGRGE